MSKIKTFFKRLFYMKKRNSINVLEIVHKNGMEMIR